MISSSENKFVSLTVLAFLLIALPLGAAQKDSTPPTQPANPIATASGCSQINLAWDPSTDPSANGQSTAGLKGYYVYLQGSGTPLTFVTTANATVAPLAGNTLYTFQIAAVDNSNNVSTLSVPVSGTTLRCSDSLAPSVPTGVAALVLDCGQISLSWQPSTDSPSSSQQVSGVNGYNIYRGGAFLKFVSGGATTTATDANLQAAASYSYEVSALDVVGNESARSTAAPVTLPPCPPDPPTGLTGRALNCHRVDLSWTAPANPGSGLAGYKVYRDGNFIEQVDSPSFSEAAPAPATSFSYWVTTVDSWGRESVLSTPVTVTVPGCPASSAGNLRINRAGSLVQIQWDGTPGALYQAQSSLGFFGPWVGVDAPTTELSVTNRNDEPSAIYRVALFTNTPAYLANFEVNNGDKAAPATPDNFNVIAASETEAVLSWDAAADNGTLDGGGQTFTSGLDRYLIYRDGAFLKSEPASATGSSDNTVVAETEYTYSIATLDKAGNRSGTASHSVLMRKQCNYTISPGSASISAAGGAGSFSMSSANGCSWSAQTVFAWIHTSSSGNGSGSVSYTVDANTGLSQRSGTITAGTKTFTITQAGVSCSYSLAPTSFSHDAGAGNGSFGVTVGSGCGWSATTSYGWIHTTSSGNGNGTVNYTLDANTGTGQRFGTISVGGQTYTVYQAGVSCSYSLNPTSAGHTSSSQTGAFGISSPAGCSWVATTIYGWIHTSSSGSGNGTVSYTVDANTGASSRSGTITAGGQTFTVNQSGVNCTYALNPTSASHSALLENGSFGVTVGAGCSWSAGTSYGWIHTTSSGNGSGTVNYSVDANGSASPRSGTITAGGQTFTINQAGLVVCNYSLSASSASFGSGGGSGSVGVTTAGSCSWTAGSGAGWITINSGAVGLGSGSVGYSVAGNGSTSSRSGTMTIAGQTFTVNQAGSGASDTTPPAASFLSPAGGAFLGGAVQLKAMVSDNASIGTVEFYVDNNGDLALVGTSQGSGTLSTNVVTYNTTNILNGQHTFYCRPFDTSGNSSWAWVTVTVSNYNADPGTVTWAKDIGQSPVSGEAQTASVKTDSQGNQIVVGKFSGSAKFGGTTVNSQGAFDLFVAKFTVDGTLAWFRTYGGAYDNVATSVAVDGADNIFVTGYFVGSMDLGGGLLTSGGGNNNADIFVAKFNSGGAHVWSKRFGGSYGNYGYGIGVDRNNDVIVTGQYSVQADFGAGPVQSAGGGDGFVVKFSGQNGTYAWARSFGGSGSDYPQGLAVDGNGDALVTGYSTGSMDFGGGLRPNAGGSDAFLAKFSGANGAHVWSKMVGGSGNEGANGIAVDAVGNGVLAGSFTSTLNLGGVSLSAPLSTAMFIAKYDSGSGALMWAMSVGGQSSIGGTVGPRVAGVDSAGNVVVTGNATGEADFGNGVVTAGTGNIFIAKYSSVGSYIWSKRFSSSGWSAGMGLAIDRSRNIFGTGSFSGTVDFEGFSLSSSSTQTKDAFLVKISP